MKQVNFYSCHLPHGRVHRFFNGGWIKIKGYAAQCANIFIN